MPESPPANRLLAHAMREGSETPGESFDRYLLEHDPDLPDRYRRPGYRPLHPYRGGAGVGVVFVVVGLLAHWIGVW